MKQALFGETAVSAVPFAPANLKAAKEKNEVMQIVAQQAFLEETTVRAVVGIWTVGMLLVWAAFGATTGFFEAFASAVGVALVSAPLFWLVLLVAGHFGVEPLRAKRFEQAASLLRGWAAGEAQADRAKVWALPEPAYLGLGKADRAVIVNNRATDFEGVRLPVENVLDAKLAPSSKTETVSGTFSHMVFGGAEPMERAPSSLTDQPERVFLELTFAAKSGHDPVTMSFDFGTDRAEAQSWLDGIQDMRG